MGLDAHETYIMSHSTLNKGTEVSVFDIMQFTLKDMITGRSALRVRSKNFG